MKKYFSKKIAALLLTAGLSFGANAAFATLPPFSKIIFFGDSLSDVGNYVEPAPIPCVRVNAPVTNTTGGANPGKLWANTTVLGFFGTPSKLGGNDWAVSGAETCKVEHTTPTVPLPLACQGPTQVDQYLASVRNTADPGALYVIWAGSNDILERVITSPSPPSAIAQGMTNILSALTALELAGARNFLVIGVPDISLTPIAQAPTNPSLLLGIIKQPAQQAGLHAACLGWNQQLLGFAATFKRRLAQNGVAINMFYWDPNPTLTAAVRNPGALGFTHGNTEIWCNPKGNSEPPDNYLFFNFIHPTSHAQALIAGAVRQQAVPII